MATIYQKTVDDKCVILDARGRVQRDADIPANWKVVDLIAAVSLTTSASDNATPSSETVVRSGVQDCFFFGLKDFSSTAPGLTGASFIGFSLAYGSLTSRIDVSGSYVRTCAGAGFLSPSATVSSGATLSAASSSDASDTYFTMAPLPAGGTGYARWMAIRLDRSVAGTLTAKCQSPIANITDVSTTAMQAFLGAATWGYSSAVAFSGVESLDVRSFYLRYPQYNSRLRVHNMGVRFVS